MYSRIIDQLCHPLNLIALAAAISALLCISLAFSRETYDTFVQARCDGAVDWLAHVVLAGSCSVICQLIAILTAVGLIAPGWPSAGAALLAALGLVALSWRAERRAEQSISRSDS